MRAKEKPSFTGYFDMHSHLVPGVDDGSDSYEESFKILEKAYMGGVRTMILTPHFRLGMFETPPDVTERRFSKLQEEAKKLFPELQLFHGCEFHANMEMEELLQKEPRFFLAGSRWLLLEFSGYDRYAFVRERVQAAMSLNARVIIAHVERIHEVREDIGKAEELKRLGAFLQVNADSVLGVDGSSFKRFSNRLIKEGLASFIGSDAHNLTSRPFRLPECAAYLEKKYGGDTVKRLLFENPGWILKE